MEARRLADALGSEVWPSWATPFELLLVGEAQEYLIGSRRSPDGFEELREDPELGPVAVRPRVFATQLEATMPAFGPPATIVVGTAKATDRSPTGWMLMLLHEHFHQWQMRSTAYFEAVAALDLAGDDTTGRWMLDYPFPYDSPPVVADYERVARALAGLLRRPADEDIASEAEALWDDYAAWLSELEDRDRRYLRFQLWQEGVARFVELRVAEKAGAGWKPSPSVTALEGFEDFSAAACAAWELLFEQLEEPDLPRRRRVSFYALGAGLALLLDRTEPTWKSRYEEPRFRLAPN